MPDALPCSRATADGWSASPRAGHTRGRLQVPTLKVLASNFSAWTPRPSPA
ncbi:hypothetical protein [Scleromatobacter humisilvae]|uniref:Uncharacterized protein n=1 Tax=Scleromatobacter humisilvae TaxID=2897159 RepID=A0A9X2C047_9BURK|nr:hypothetical protein [Scleromatobacter humisilvae]MCK9686972.1 hypothetical protein [Scleromatobacter humisilvae]